MREIKFRAWHKEQGKMYPAEELGADQLTIMPDGRGFANISGGNIQLSQIDNDEKMIPLQYTGLHDRNGVEIYEGDIVKFMWNDEWISPVYWTDERGWTIHSMSVWEYNLAGRHGIEIVGNIYENPELVKA